MRIADAIGHVLYADMEKAETEQAFRNIKYDMQVLLDVGRIVVRVYRAEESHPTLRKGHHKHRAAGVNQSANNLEVHEKALKVTRNLSESRKFVFTIY